jgi:hypothetical protein
MSVRLPHFSFNEGIFNILFGQKLNYVDILGILAILGFNVLMSLVFRLKGIHH